MKTSKEERIMSFVKTFIKIYNGDKKDAQQILDIIIVENPYLINTKLSTPERTLIANKTKEFIDNKNKII